MYPLYFPNAHVIIVSMDPLPRLVWEEKKISSLPDWSGKLQLFIPSQTSLASKVNVQLPRPVWEAESLCSQPDWSVNKWQYSTCQISLWSGRQKGDASSHTDLEIGLNGVLALPVVVAVEQSGHYFGPIRVHVLSLWLQNEVATIFVTIFHFFLFSSTYFSQRRGCAMVLKFCMGF